MVTNLQVLALLAPQHLSRLSQGLKDSYLSRWFKKIDAKLISLGLSTESLTDLDLVKAHKIIQTKLWEGKFALLCSSLNPVCSPLFFGLSPLLAHSPNYFSTLINPLIRRAFMLAHFNISPSSVHFGRFLKIPRDSRICRFCSLVPNTLEHILLHCPAHQPPHNSLLNPLLWHSPGPLFYPVFALLSDNLPEITIAVADFLYQISRLITPL